MSEETERAVEALLFAAAGPLALADIQRRLPEGADVDAAIAALQARYAGRGVELAEVGGRWRLQTAGDLASARPPRKSWPSSPTISRSPGRRWSRCAAFRPAAARWTCCWSSAS